MKENSGLRTAVPATRPRASEASLKPSFSPSSSSESASIRSSNSESSVLRIGTNTWRAWILSAAWSCTSIIWKPNEVWTGVVISPTCAEKAASENSGTIWSRLNHPNSPEPPKRSGLVMTSSKGSPSISCCRISIANPAAASVSVAVGVLSMTMVPTVACAGKLNSSGLLL